MPENALPTEPKLSDFLCFAVYAAGHGFNRVYKPLLEPLGLTYPQYLVMTALQEQDDQTVGGLGDRLSLESNTLTPLLKRLENRGRIKRVRDPRDERQVRVRLTAAGRALASKTAHIPHCILEASGLSAADLIRLQRQVTMLNKALESFTESKPAA
jgi:DNA-binding MarR family transcriptional regulator